MFELIAVAMLVQAPDQSAYQAVGYASAPQVTLMLREQQGVCPRGWSMALLVARAAPVYWVGCWQVDAGKVKATFEDGDTLELPFEAVTWRPGKRPAAL